MALPTDFPTVAPWTFELDEKARTGLTRRLLFEVTPGHQLWELGAVVIGRSGANDDVVAALRDGGFAIVHLVWGQSPGDANWPATRIYSTKADLLESMATWSREAGFLEE